MIMKTQILLSLLLCLFCFSAFGQDKSQDYQLDARLGIGLFPTFLKDDATVNVLPLTAQMDYRLNKMFSLGAYAGYSKSTALQEDIFAEGDDLKWENQFISTGIRATIHYQTEYKNWEIYGGFIAAMNFSNINVLEGRPSTVETLQLKDRSSFSYSAFVGTRFHFTDQIGVFGELGFMTSLANIGFSYRF